jgi:hypothetical protein
MLLRFALSDSELAVACAQVFAADNICVCRWETAVTALPTKGRLFKLLG